MVDCHSHVTGPGGANWIDALRRSAGDDGEGGGAQRPHRPGGRRALDAGRRVADRVDPADGRERALALGVRDRWAGRPDRPYLRAAGSWLFKRGRQPDAATIEAETGDELLAAAIGQLDAGADLVKVYMDGPDVNVSPWTANEVAAVVEAVHAARGAGGGALRAAERGARGRARRASTRSSMDSSSMPPWLPRWRPRDDAREHAGGDALVAVVRRDHDMERFAGEAGSRHPAARLEQGEASVRVARDAGVRHRHRHRLRRRLAARQPAGVGGDEPRRRRPRAGRALAAATWRGGELIGEADAGVIREGGPADFFLVHGDPLSDPEALWRVWRTAWET